MSIETAEGMRPMLVRAHLAGGVALDAQWGTALDGLLASVVWAARKGQLHDRGIATSPLADTPDPQDMPLPLARCRTPEGDWHWAATCALPEGVVGDGTEVRYWTGRLDLRHAEQVASDVPMHLYTHQGRWRNRIMPLIITTCRSVTWRAVGDADVVRELLETVAAIGKKRSQGEGQVLRWEVQALSDVSVWEAAHLHADGTLGRPTPPGCLSAPAGRPPHGGLGRAGIRPPYQHPSRQRELMLPPPLSGLTDEG
ncbi:hypothetical protein [Wenjunlia tyrosinilytica]|nr:hypothetical protein [Wenjunlia tyrosinilytica]